MEFKKKTKNISTPFEMSYSGIKNITLKEKYFCFLSTLTSKHRKSKFKSEHLPISNYVQFAQWVKYKDLHGNKQLRSQP